MIHRFICVVLALVALVATSAAFRALSPPEIPAGVDEKLKFFAEHKDDFDTLFVGTSRFHYSLSPEIFERLTRADGVATHAFNFGIDGMHPPENFYVLDRILETKPRNLKWVFVEFGQIETLPFGEMRGTKRYSYWHDWPRTWLVIKKTLNPREGLKWYGNVSRIWRNRRVLALHLGLFRRELLNVGGAIDYFSSVAQDQEITLSQELGPKHDGYRPTGPAMPAEKAVNYQKTLAVEVSEARSKTIDSCTENAYRAAADKIRKIGAVPIFVVTPIISQSPLHFRPAPPPPALISFNDAKAYPSLYDSSIRVDESHLTDVGGTEFTRLLAQEFLRETRRP